MPRNAVRYSSVALTATMLAVVATMVAVLVIAPLASALVQRWSRQDVELRTRLVFDSVRNNLTRLLAVSNSAAIGEAFDRLSSDDRVLAVGYCDESDTMRFQTSMMPPGFSCEKAMRSDEASFSPLVSDGVQLIAGTFPITVKNAKGHLVILQDLSFVKERAAEVRTLLTFVLGAIVFVSTALASLAVMVVTQRDMKAVRLAINNLRLGQSPDAGTNLGSLDKELRSMLRQMDTSRISPLNGGQANWTAETVRNVVECELAGAEVIVISNREPYIHNCTNDGGIELQRPASGLVSALEPVTRACGGIWIAHGSGSADRSVVDAADHIRVPPEDPRYTLRRIWINDDELDGYYYGLANEGLWPLCHIAFVRPVFRETDWRTYRVVNEKFADAVAKEATSDAPVVLVQDFHFALLPRMVRERLPNAMIVTFWHIPWPNSETFGICPLYGDFFVKRVIALFFLVFLIGVPLSTFCCMT